MTTCETACPSGTKEEDDIQPRITDSHHLRPKLWGRLPNDLKDVIIDKVLVDIPFSRLLSISRICPRWRAFLLNRQYLLYCHKDQCKVFNSRKGLWESVSLQFCQDGLSLGHLQQASSTRDLLCLSTDVDGEFVVVNPLTESYRRTGRPVDDAQTNTPAQMTSFAGVTELTEMILPSGKRGWLAGFVGRLDTGRLFLSITKLRGTTFVLDRLSDSWESTANVPGDFALLIGGPKVQSNFGTKMTLGFGSCSHGFKFFAYDLKLKKVSDCAFTLPCATPRKGQTLCVIENEEGMLEFLEIQNTGLTLTSAESPFPPFTLTSAESPFPPSTKIQLTEKNPDDWFKISSILLVKDSPGRTFHGIIFVKILASSLPLLTLRQIDRVNDPLPIINGMVWEPYVEVAGGGTLATRFQIFRPSLSPP